MAEVDAGATTSLLLSRAPPFIRACAAAGGAAAGGAAAGGAAAGGAAAGGAAAGGADGAAAATGAAAGAGGAASCDAAAASTLLTMDWAAAATAPESAGTAAATAGASPTFANAELTMAAATRCTSAKRGALEPGQQLGADRRLAVQRVIRQLERLVSGAFPERVALYEGLRVRVCRCGIAAGASSGVEPRALSGLHFRDRVQMLRQAPIKGALAWAASGWAAHLAGLPEPPARWCPPLACGRKLS
jgi:hypothetical protein